LAQHDSPRKDKLEIFPTEQYNGWGA